MSALVNSKAKPLKRTINGNGPKVVSMSLEVYTNIHGTFGDFKLKYGCVAYLIGTGQLTERFENDKTMQWMGGLISSSRSPPSWADSYKSSLPREAQVEYLWPSAVNNLSRWAREVNGEEQQLPGGWVWQALAPSLTSLRACIDALVQKAMRVQQTADSDNFYQGEPDTNILTRNVATSTKTWEAKYNVVLAPRGNIDADFQAWIKDVMTDYSFFIFDGSLASCSDMDFQAEYACAFTKPEEAMNAIRARDDAIIGRYLEKPNNGASPHRGAPMTGASPNAATVAPASASHGIVQSTRAAPLPPAAVTNGGEPALKRVCRGSILHLRYELTSLIY